MTTLESIEDPTDSMLGKAKKVSKLSPQNFQVGAVIVQRGRVVAKGYNSYKTHPVWGNPEKGYHFLHAECAAMYDAQKKGIDINGATVYVYRRNHRLAKPCNDCYKKMKANGVVEVKYSA